MASNAVREAFWAALVGSAELAALGYSEDTLYPQFSPDSPPRGVFGVLRWGPTTPGVGPANSVDLSLWLYDQDPSYERITSGLRLVRNLWGVLPAVRLAGTAGEAIIGVSWSGAGPDLYDDAYRAYVRYETYRVTASGN